MKRLLFMSISLLKIQAADHFNENVQHLYDDRAGFYCRGVAFQDDGNIIVGGVNGYARGRAYRLHSDGTVDTNFKPFFNYFDPADQTALGYSPPAIFAVASTPAGALIGGSGVFQIDASAHRLRSGLVRLNSDGTHDTSFKPPIDLGLSWGPTTIRGIYVQSGKILLNGTIFISVDAPPAVRGSILSLCRLTISGDFDTTFYPGTRWDSVSAISVQDNGTMFITKSVVDNSGIPEYLLLLENDGSMRAGWRAEKLDVALDISSGSCLAVQGDGKILVGGAYVPQGVPDPYSHQKGFLRRLNPDGSTDKTFKVKTFADRLEKIVSLKDGSFWINFYAGLGVVEPRYASRFDPDGTPDPDSSGATKTAAVYAKQPDGKLIVGQPNLARLTNPVTHGVDVSHFQNRAIKAANKQIPWDLLKATGVAFAIVKASEGLDSENPTDRTHDYFEQNISTAKSALGVVGAYHLANPERNGPEAEAKFFVNKARAYIGSGYLPPALDLEYNLSRIQDETLSTWVRQWLREVECQTGVIPVLYLGELILKKLDWDLRRDYPIWLITWGNEAGDPAEIAPETYRLSGLGAQDWLSGEWTLQQYTSHGKIDGVEYDFDTFNGSLGELIKLCRRNYPPRILGALGKVFQVPTAGPFEFEIAAHGRNSITVQSSNNLSNWEDAATLQIQNGRAVFTDSSFQNRAGANFFILKP